MLGVFDTQESTKSNNIFNDIKIPVPEMKKQSNVEQNESFVFENTNQTSKKNVENLTPLENLMKDFNQQQFFQNDPFKNQTFSSHTTSNPNFNFQNFTPFSNNLNQSFQNSQKTNLNNTFNFDKPKFDINNRANQQNQQNQQNTQNKQNTQNTQNKQNTQNTQNKQDAFSDLFGEDFKTKKPNLNQNTKKTLNDMIQQQNKYQDSDPLKKKVKLNVFLSIFR